MKYNIENNIDFYKELYISLYEDIDKTDIVDDNSNVCLISNLPLKDYYIKLNCGHKFNYEPLYKDILNHKKKFNYLEQNKNKLALHQIRCPYCRNIQNELLPYYEHSGLPKVNGVNYYDINNYSHPYDTYINPENQCQYQTITYDTSGNSHTTQCNHFGYVHYILKSKYNDETKYCHTHKLAVLKNIREKLKEQKLALKLEAKNKKLEEKNKKKMELKQNETENKNSINNANYCIAILKTGKCKGSQCNTTIFKDSLCKRHFNIKNKNSNLVLNHHINENESEAEENQENIVLDKDIKI
jgi:hypothetical protein